MTNAKKSDKNAAKCAMQASRSNGFEAMKFLKQIGSFSHDVIAIPIANTAHNLI